MMLTISHVSVGRIYYIQQYKMICFSMDDITIVSHVLVIFKFSIVLSSGWGIFYTTDTYHLWPNPTVDVNNHLSLLDSVSTLKRV